MHRLLLAAALLFAVIDPGAAQTLRIALRADPDMLDPSLARTYVGRIVFAGLCDKLFDIDDRLNIVPQLATGYEWADSRTLLIHLRDGVVFQDGARMDAAAVKYSLDRHRTMPGSFRRGELAAIDRVEITGPLDIRVVLKTPSSPLLSQLTDRAGMIVSPRAAEAAGADFALHPVCAGPFQFTERVANDRIVLDRFAGYWDAGRIHFDRVVYRAIPDTSVRVANLRAGGVDLSEQVAPNDVAAIEADPKLRIVTSDALGYYGITNNLANGPRADTPYGRDPRVRKALEYAIDRTTLAQVVYLGMVTPTAQAVPAGSPLFSPQLQPQPRDVARARALLRDAGVSLPVRVELVLPNSPDIRQAGEVIQAMAAEAGFDIRLWLLEYAVTFDVAERGDFEAYLQNWSGRTDADGNIWDFLHSGAPSNVSHWSNATADAALDNARRVSDPAARLHEYGIAWNEESRELPVTYLWINRNIVGLSARLSGFVPVADGLIRLQGMALRSP